MTSSVPRETLSTAELIRRMTEEGSSLVRDEFRLARLELAQKGRRAGAGARLFGGAGAAALYGGGSLVAGVILLLALVMPAWLAAVVVGVVLLILAAVLGLLGRRRMTEAAPPIPRRTIESVKGDIDAVRERVHR